MALEFARTHIISRGSGHTAVKASAYRSGENLRDDRADRNSDYSHRRADVAHSEILLPAGADVSLSDRVTLWNAVEEREDRSTRRATAQLAKDHILALPKELTPAQHLELARSFADERFVSKGFVVDMNIHYHSDGNPHVHMMTTLRKLDGREFGNKDRSMNGDFYRNGRKVADVEQLRHQWAEHQNAYFKTHAMDLTVENNDGLLEPEIHVGPRKWINSTENNHPAVALNRSKIQGRAAAILENPAIVIERVSARKSVFTRHDLYRELHKLVDDKALFSAIKAKLDNHEHLVSIGLNRGQQPVFTSRDVVKTEQAIAQLGAELTGVAKKFAIEEKHIAAALAEQSFLSKEQQAAVRHTLEPNRLANVVGLAGAGKSTMLRSMRDASEAAGHRVMGVALAGKAAEELSQSSGIASRTIASFLNAHQHEKLDIGAGDIIVMDEAGMVNSKTMLSVMSVVERAGAKLVLVGDGEQLQPIQAGSPFKVLSEKFGSANIETIRRQQTDWQREATFDLAKGRGEKAFLAYKAAGHVVEMAKKQVIETLVNDYVNDREAGVSQSILAHRNVDVKTINTLVRDRLKADGKLTPGRTFSAGSPSTNAGIPLGTQVGDSVIFSSSRPGMGVKAGDRATYVGEQNGMQTLQLDTGGEFSFSSENAPVLEQDLESTATELELSVGDRILFTKNDNRLGVKNGMLGTLLRYDDNRVVVELDDGKQVDFTAGEYASIEHGYATTIHKSQGMTVDKVYLMGSNTMDKHLGYVGFSRHRESLGVYLPAEDFRQQSFGELISRANHQQSVLDIAQKQGLSFDETDVGKTEFVDPDATTLNDQTVKDPQSVPRGGAATDTPDINHAVALPDTASNTKPLTTESVDTAFSIVESTRLSLIEEMNKDAEVGIREAEREQRIAERKLSEHQALEPKQGLFGGKAKHQEWQSTLNALEKAVATHSSRVDRLKREQQSNQEVFSRNARKLAAERHPEETNVLNLGKLRDKKAAILDRIVATENRITSEMADGGSSTRVTALQDTLGRAINELAQDEAIYSTLTSDERQSLALSKEQLSQDRKARSVEERNQSTLER